MESQEQAEKPLALQLVEACEVLRSKGDDERPRIVDEVEEIDRGHHESPEDDHERCGVSIHVPEQAKERERHEQREHTRYYIGQDTEAKSHRMSRNAHRRRLSVAGHNEGVL